MKLSSNKPYLLRATYEWIVDNNATPFIVFFTEHHDVLVPEQFINDGKIILNISPSAAQSLLIENESISFSARFGGKPFNIYAPISMVLSLYASENGEGLSFEVEPFDTPPDDPKPTVESVSSEGEKPESSDKPKKSKRPSLKIVK